jgi:hypothetical protein
MLALITLRPFPVYSFPFFLYTAILLPCELATRVYPTNAALPLLLLHRLPLKHERRPIVRLY